MGKEWGKSGERVGKEWGSSVKTEIITVKLEIITDLGRKSGNNHLYVGIKFGKPGNNHPNQGKKCGEEWGKSGEKVGKEWGKSGERVGQRWGKRAIILERAMTFWVFGGTFSGSKGLGNEH